MGTRDRFDKLMLIEDEDAVGAYVGGVTVAAFIRLKASQSMLLGEVSGCALVVTDGRNVLGYLPVLSRQETSRLCVVARTGWCAPQFATRRR